MNNIIVVGRLTKDPEIRYVGENNIALATFTLAVPRSYKPTNGKKKVDFLNSQLWGNMAEVGYKYLKKGSQIVLQGSMEVDDYINANGEKRYITKIKGSRFTFADTKKAEPLEPSDGYYNADQIFEQELQENPLSMEELPF